MSYYNYGTPIGQRGCTPRLQPANRSPFSNARQVGAPLASPSVYGRGSQSQLKTGGSNQYSYPSGGGYPGGYQQPQLNRGSQSQIGTVGRAGIVRSNASMQFTPPAQMMASNAGVRAPVCVSPAMAPSQNDNEQIGPDGVKYISLNWQDILGGKEGMKGLRLSMAPSGDPGNPNRQIKFSVGPPGQGGDGGLAPGEVPLKIVSFEPVADYPGKGGKPMLMSPQAQTMQGATVPARRPSAVQMQQTPSQFRMQTPTGQQGIPQMGAFTPQMGASVNGGHQGGQQPQMIMMPPIYMNSKGQIRAPPQQQANSCKGCPNCVASANQSQSRPY